MLFVFMSQPDYACNPHALYEYIKTNTEHETAWILKRDGRYYDLKERGIRCAVYNTLEGNMLLAEADYVIMNSYTFLRIPKRENQIFVNLWHGSGIKAHDFYSHNMNPAHAEKLTDYFDMIDLLCVHSLDDRFKLSAQLHFDLRKCYVTGQPRLDCVKESNGFEKLKKLFGGEIEKYDKFIFFAPSFRANMSSHSGTIFSDNIFRLNDYEDERLKIFLEKNRAALIYKLHPIEQTAFEGRLFRLNQHCFELTDNLLFECDIRYDELLNVFDVMISDYSSIAYDYLILNRPIIYLIPDYEEYTSERGFVFHNIDQFMPGEKVFCFDEMISALYEAIEIPDKHRKERELVLSYRFDYMDNQSSKRCYETIMKYQKTAEPPEKKPGIKEQKFPSSAELIKRWIPKQYKVIDSTREIPDEYAVSEIDRNIHQEYLYITEEIPRELRKLTGRSSDEIEDIAYYDAVCQRSNVRMCYITGGVDYDFFAMHKNIAVSSTGRSRIGFAGTIDNRIYFAMVQCICEVFSNCDVIFAGEIFGNFPVWLKGFENLHYVNTEYKDLPEVIQSFDVAILPFFGRHKNAVPKEYFQYLACGKQVVASDMVNLPKSEALYCSASVDEAVKNIKTALLHINDERIITSAKRVAKEYNWERVVQSITTVIT